MLARWDFTGACLLDVLHVRPVTNRHSLLSKSANGSGYLEKIGGRRAGLIELQLLPGGFA